MSLTVRCSVRNFARVSCLIECKFSHGFEQFQEIEVFVLARRCSWSTRWVSKWLLENCTTRYGVQLLQPIFGALLVLCFQKFFCGAAILARYSQEWAKPAHFCPMIFTGIMILHLSQVRRFSCDAQDAQNTIPCANFCEHFFFAEEKWPPWQFLPSPLRFHRRFHG